MPVPRRVPPRARCQSHAQTRDRRDAGAALTACARGGARVAGNPALISKAILMNTDKTTAATPITAELVLEDDRYQVLPRHFGRYMILVEDAVYQATRRLVSEYDRGYWKCYELSNGGFYMAPDLRPMRVAIGRRGCGHEMSADAIGITVCLLTFRRGSYQYPQSSFARQYDLLREFACLHSEAALIGAAIH